MKIISWNVNGIKSTEKDLLELISSEQPDVIGIQEVKSHPDTLGFELKMMAGYSAIWNWHRSRNGYSGTCIFYRSDLGDVKTHISMEEDRFDVEGRYTQVDIDDYSIINIYFPFGGGKFERQDYKLDFHRRVSEKVKELGKEGRKVILMGDVNIAHQPIDIFDPIGFQNKSVFLPQERAWLDEFIDIGFIDTFRKDNDGIQEFSWWPYTDPLRTLYTGMRIDYILTCADISFSDPKILKDIPGSDHVPVIATIH